MTADLLPRHLPERRGDRGPRAGRGGRSAGARPIPWRWVAALAWCAVLGWFAFVRGARVPLLSFADLGFHELGHLVMYLLPIHEVLTAAMGSIAQVAVPAGLATYFWAARSDRVAAAVCAAWAGTSLQNVSVYAADAPYERLELIGGEHDWAFLLSADGLDRMESAAGIAAALRGTGLVVLLAAAALCLAGAAGLVPDRELA